MSSQRDRKHEARNQNQHISAGVVIQYESHQEKLCSLLLQHFCGFKPELGRTYQRPISKRHAADFFIPERNCVVEYHPPVIKWYGAPGVFNRIKRLNSHLSSREQAELQDIICSQITHEYYKRRRALMDVSTLSGVPQMRLLVCADFQDFYQLVVKPFSIKQLNYQQYKDYLERIGK